jgi:nitroreductase
MAGRWQKASSSSALARNAVLFADVVRSRRMTRSFRSDPVDSSLLESCVELGLRAPSAGKSQGWHVLLLQGEETSRYWDNALPLSKRESFAFPHLLNAPVIALMLADTSAYLQRYSEPDKAHTELGTSVDAWVAPYWTIDASFSTMTFLLALEDNGLGALFFAHANEEKLRAEFQLPDGVQILGTVALGYATQQEPRRGRSATRQRKTIDEVIHRSQW